MRLHVIGSSPAWPNPGSAQSGYLVEGEGRLLLDCGPGVLARLREADVVDVAAIAITHFHLDHWGDLVSWVWLSTFGTRPPRRAELWLPPDGRAELDAFAERWGNADMWDSTFDLREYGDGTPFEAAGFTVEPARLPHYSIPSYGFRVRDGAATLAYTGDSAPDERLDAFARGADLLLVEATLDVGASDGEPRGHLSADEALAAADGPVLLTHRPAELPVPDGVPLARDGLVVEI